MRLCVCLYHSLHLLHTIRRIPSRLLIIDTFSVHSSVGCTDSVNVMGIYASFVFRNKTLISKLVRLYGVFCLSLCRFTLFVVCSPNNQLCKLIKKFPRKSKEYQATLHPLLTISILLRFLSALSGAHSRGLLLNSLHNKDGMSAVHACAILFGIVDYNLPEMQYTREVFGQQCIFDSVCSQ